MQGAVPEKIWLYRIVHYMNLPGILANGLVTATHEKADPNYIGIGDTTLMPVRGTRSVTTPPYGQLGDYVPFYLGPHSPMLLQIKTGNQGVTLRPQGEIIYIISSIDKLNEHKHSYCFTDGHAWNKMTRFFHQNEDWEKIDWSLVKEHYWQNTEEDKDRQRRKQAEVLVHQHVSVDCIDAIVVYDDERASFVKMQLEKFNLNIPVHLSKNKKHYY